MVGVQLRKLDQLILLISNMKHDTKLEYLGSIQTVLERADYRLSYDQLPNRYDIQRALKFANTLIICEKEKHMAEQRWIKFKYDDG